MSVIETAMHRARGTAPPVVGGGTTPAPRAATRQTHTAAPVRQFLPMQPDQTAMERSCLLPQITDRSALRAYKILRTRVLQRMTSKQWYGLAVTGVDSGTGKTITATNLAMALAQDPNTSVFLVDLDLQRPKVAEYMGVSVTKGLGDYLLGEASIDDIIYSPDIDRLAVIPNSRSCQQSSDLLSGGRMLELVARLEAEMPRRIIIYDMPPLLLSDDVLTFAPTNADGVLLVVSEGLTARGMLEKSKDLLAEVNIVGVVLNRSMERNDSAYY